MRPRDLSFLVLFYVVSITKLRSSDSNWQLVFTDEFEKDGQPNPEIWTPERGFVRNQELQWYQLENATVKDGRLVIEARQETIPNPDFDPNSDDWRKSRPEANYTSACLKTRDRYSFQYGKLEVKARIPAASGMWPAIWTLGVEKPWPACGEIDVLEFYLSEGQPTILANAAWPSASMYPPIWDVLKVPYSHFLTKDPDWANKFHVWTLEWNAESITISLDDDTLHEIPVAHADTPDGFNPFRQPHYILLNLAVGSNGGDPSATVFPQRYEIDYVRVYQPVSRR